MHPSIFREYDIRGVYPSELDEEAARRIAGAFAAMLAGKGGKTVAVGGDVRLHTAGLKGAFIETLLARGLDVIDIGTVTTPLCYFSAFRLPVDGFAMVTASHNPKEYNGFKLGVGKHTLYGRDIAAIRAAAEAAEGGPAPAAGARGKLERRDLVPDYIARMAGEFTLSRPLRVALDPANATGALFAADLLRAIGAQVDVINGTVDGTFPSHHPDPTIAANMAQLAGRVRATGAEVGIGLDGDSDRVGIVDEDGNLIPGDLITLILARDVLARNPGAKIIYEVKCSMAMEEVIRAAGGVPVMWKVGHSLLKNKMQAEQAPLAGEMSGHIFMADRYYGYDDALYAACRFLEIMDKTGKSPSALLEGIPLYHNTPEIRVECADDAAKFDLAAKAAAWFRARYPVVDIDGVRILHPDGWGLVRASNTQPSLVTRFEGKTPEARDRIRDEVLGKLRELGDVRVGGAH